MIEVECKQGSPEWIAARIGIPTASQFHRILTPKTMKPSSAAKGYIAELCAEWALDASLDEGASQFMERGSEMESSAVRYYELQRDVETRAVGFCLRGTRQVGCSPDRLVGDDGGLEIKCPSPKVHVGHLLGALEDDHRCQVQGCMWITERSWWDVMSFHPLLPPALVRCLRDEPFITALETAVEDFRHALELAKRQLAAMGCSPADLAEAEAALAAASDGTEITAGPDDRPPSRRSSGGWGGPM